MSFSLLVCKCPEVRRDTNGPLSCSAALPLCCLFLLAWFFYLLGKMTWTVVGQPYSGSSTEAQQVEGGFIANVCAVSSLLPPDFLFGWYLGSDEQCLVSPEVSNLTTVRDKDPAGSSHQTGLISWT